MVIFLYNLYILRMFKDIFLLDTAQMLFLQDLVQQPRQQEEDCLEQHSRLLEEVSLEQPQLQVVKGIL